MAPAGPFVAALVLSTAAASAQAVTVVRTEVAMATGACQAALPAFEGQIRKRPLAVQNEGTAPAFVTCAYEGPDFFSPTSRRNQLSVLPTNNNAVATEISCTFVDGRSGMADPVYFTRTELVPAGMQTELLVDRNQNGGNNFMFPAVSCNLRPGMAINATYQRWNEDVGA